MALAHHGSPSSSFKVRRKQAMSSILTSKENHFQQIKGCYLGFYDWLSYQWSEVKAYFGFTLSRDKRRFLDGFDPSRGEVTFYQGYADVFSKQSGSDKLLEAYASSPDETIFLKLVSWVKSKGGRLHQTFYHCCGYNVDDERLVKAMLRTKELPRLGGAGGCSGILKYSSLHNGQGAAASGRSVRFSSN